MNTNNVRTAIKVMQRVRYNEYPFNLEKWQEGKHRVTEQGAANCGTVCCFATWLAISPEGKRAGFTVIGYSSEYINYVGSPEYKYYVGSEAIAAYLDIPVSITKRLVGVGEYIQHTYYGKPLAEVTPTDVIEALINILNNVTECFN